MMREEGEEVRYELPESLYEGSLRVYNQGRSLRPLTSRTVSDDHQNSKTMAYADSWKCGKIFSQKFPCAGTLPLLACVVVNDAVLGIDLSAADGR